MLCHVLSLISTQRTHAYVLSAALHTPGFTKFSHPVFSAPWSFLPSYYHNRGPERQAPHQQQQRPKLQHCQLQRQSFSNQIRSPWQKKYIPQLRGYAHNQWQEYQHRSERCVSSTSSKRRSSDKQLGAFFNCSALKRVFPVHNGVTLAAARDQQKQSRLLLFPRMRCEYRDRQSRSNRWLPHNAAPLVHCAGVTNTSTYDNSSASSSSKINGSSSDSSGSKVNGSSKAFASRKESRQQVLIWGSRAAFPGGVDVDVMKPREVSWFRDAAAARGAPFTRLSFGPSFGVALNSRGEVAMWGSFNTDVLQHQQGRAQAAAADLLEAAVITTPGGANSPPEVASITSPDSLCFSGPFFLKLPFAVVDAQCSAAEIFFLSDGGRVYYLESALLPLLLTAYQRKQEKHDERKQRDQTALEQPKAKGEQQVVDVQELPANPVELKGFPASSWGHGSTSWVAWLGCLLPYWSFRSSTRVKKMSVGYSHAAFVTEAGELYTCGSNSFGECGVPPDPFDKTTLHVCLNKVNFFSNGVSQQQLQQSNQQQHQTQGRPHGEDPFIIDVACGRRHTLCVSKTGDAYAFGDDSKIELGLGDTRSQQQMVVGTTWMERLAGRTAPAAKGASYSYADRHLQPIPQRVLKPSTLPAAHNCTATAVAAGDDFSLVLYEDIAQSYPDPLLKRNTLFCCGETALGQCGRGLQFHQQPLAAVVFPRAASAVSVNKLSAPRVHAATSRHIEGPSFVYKVEKFCCGSSHCNALMSSGKVVGWGFNPHGQVGTGSKVKGPISPAKIIDLDSERLRSNDQLCGSASGSKFETLRETRQTFANEEQLTPPLARFLRTSVEERFEVQDLFCKFDSSAVIRAPAREGSAV